MSLRNQLYSVFYIVKRLTGLLSKPTWNSLETQTGALLEAVCAPSNEVSGREVINESFPIDPMPTHEHSIPKRKRLQLLTCLLAEVLRNTLSHLMASQALQKTLTSSPRLLSLPFALTLGLVFVNIFVSSSA